MTESVRIYQENGLWIHESDDGYVVDRRINERSSLARFDQDTKDTWERLYSPRQGDVVIDVGAGIGSEIHRWSRAVGPTGLVVAIEAQPGTFACLTRFCELNKLDNVVTLNLAIMDQQGMATIDDADQHISSTILRKGGTCQVQGTSLDQVVEELGLNRIDFLKMNIEGAECLAILGMTNTLSLLRFLCISCHDFKADAGHGEFYRTRGSVVTFLEQNGFATMRRRRDDFPWIRDQVDAVPRRLALTARAHANMHDFRRINTRALGRETVRLSRTVRALRRATMRGLERVVYTLKYSRHGYTRVVALKILAVRLLRFLRLRPPPPGP